MLQVSYINRYTQEILPQCLVCYAFGLYNVREFGWDPRKGKRCVPDNMSCP